MDFDARNTEDGSDRERQAMSYAAVGAVLGISAPRVRQLEQRALKKLRRALVKQGVRSSRFAG
jgi:DNA-directed RNA polymerase sigma subunit (sigma70/sigma32)